jgi:PqqD family protein of HPr-rel-A system
MSHYPIRKGELLGPSEPEGWTIYDRETDSLHVLNDSARAIWELCDGKTSPEEMAAAISELTGIEREDSEADVGAALGELRSLGLVED